MSTAATTDLTTIEARLNDWVGRVEPGAGWRIEGLVRNGDATGQSNETLFATLVDGERRHSIVVRTGPTDAENALLPDYDIPAQFDIMRALGTASDIPVPPCRWLETDASVLGSTFYVMDAVPGQVPGDKPPHTVEGFVADATDAERERLYRSTIGALANLSRVDLDAVGLASMRPAGDGRTPIVQQLDRYERIYRWGRQDSDEFAGGERAIAWLRAHVPEQEPAGLVWGDARFANVIYHDFEPAALLDWELASVGNPVNDLAYFLVHQRGNEQHPVPEYRRPRLSGFLTDEDTVALYEELTGRPVEHFAFYWTFNAFRLVAMVQRWADLARASGWMTAEVAEAVKVSGSMVDEMLRHVDG